MATEPSTKEGLLSSFYDEGVFTPLFIQTGGVSMAFGLVGGQGVYSICQHGGPLSTRDIEMSCKTLGLAAETGSPVVTFYDSTGVKLEKGLKALRVSARLNAAIARISGVVPQIAVVAGVCGASNALAAASADLLIMAKDAQLFLTPPFLSAAAGDGLDNAGTAEFAINAGVASLIAEDTEAAVRQAARMVSILPPNNLSEAPAFDFALPGVPLDMANYTGIAAAEAIADEGSVIELNAGFGGGVVTSLATISGSVVGIVSTNGADTYLGSYCVSKTSRFMRLCDAFSIPVVTLINSGGIQKSSTGDESGNLRLAARLAGTYADATTTKVAVITGRAVGTAYIALANADLAIALEGSVVAPADPTAVVSVLYRDEIEAAENPIDVETAARAQRYAAEQAGAKAAMRVGLADMTATPETLRTQVASALNILATKRTQRMPKKHGNMAL